MTDIDLVDLRPDASAARIRAARAIAIVADLLQLAIMPVAFTGALSPIVDVIDVAVAALMVWLVGWHVAFLPTFLAELVPVLDLFPTWTAAVLFVTRGR